MPRVQRGKVSATFEAREAAGCGSLRLLRALRGTRILQAAAPTAPPCFGRRPTAAYAVCRYDPSREKVNQKNPQIFLIYKLKIKFPLNMARAERRPF